MTPAKTDNGNDTPAEGGAWAKDKQYGNRLDRSFQLNERFLILGAKLDGVIPTDLGDAEHVSLLVQKLDERGRPTGIPFVAGTLASAIVEKLKAAGEGDFPAIVELQTAPSRFGKDALVLQYVGEQDPSALLDEFGVTGETLKAVDQMRPKGERLPSSF